MTLSSPHSIPQAATHAAWRVPPPELALPDDTVHVCRAPLTLTEAQGSVFRPLLSDDEQERFDQALNEKVKRRFLAARGMLRILLGRYLDTAPERLRFDYNEHGKPSLNDPKMPLSFNVSHSGKIGLFAITWNRDIGVDVEHQKPGSPNDRMDIARRFFSVAEYDSLATVPDLLRREAFYQCWTRKEAFVKAKGVGMSLPLSSFDVSVGPDAPPALLATRWNPSEVNRWTIHALDPGSDYAGSLAVQGTDLQVACWQWSD